MATLDKLMTAVRAVRDGLHDRLDDNVSNRVFSGLRLRHMQAAIQARREVEDPGLPRESATYDAPITALDGAAAAVKTATSTDEPAMLAAIKAAKLALDGVAGLP